MDWCFAIINGKLAEIYFEKKKGKIEFLGHCYVKRTEYDSKEEQNMINEDIKNVRLRYYNRKYTKVE